MLQSLSKESKWMDKTKRVGKLGAEFNYRGLRQFCSYVQMECIHIGATRHRDTEPFSSNPERGDLFDSVGHI